MAGTRARNQTSAQLVAPVSPPGAPSSRGVADGGGTAASAGTRPSSGTDASDGTQASRRDASAEAASADGGGAAGHGERVRPDSGWASSTEGGRGSASGSGEGGEGGGNEQRASVRPGGGGGLALGVLTQSRATERWAVLEETWIGQFARVLVVESHVDVSRVQQIWKYVPQRLYTKFPDADWYLILDDDVFINAELLRAFVASRDPRQVALYGPGFCEWGVPAKVMAKAGKLLGVARMPPAVHIVIGGIMLFTAAAARKFTEAQSVMQCIDDLETLHARGVKLWGGLKESALYNQDWLFCWCLQVRLGGQVVIGDFDAFEDVDFPNEKCLTVTDAARSHVGIHHANPRRMRALWRAYLKHNGSAAPAWPLPSRPRCSTDSHGNPVESHAMGEYKYLDGFVKPPQAQRCKSIVSSKQEQAAHPSCVPHMAHLKQHPYASPCYGGLGHARCAGFQLDVNDNCNLQYALFCEGLYQAGGRQRCPAPANYPQHCCYDRALQEAGLKEGARGRRPVLAQQHLLQVFPAEPVFVGKGRGKGRGGKSPQRAPGRRLAALPLEPDDAELCALVDQEGGRRGESGDAALARSAARRGWRRAREETALNASLPAMGRC